MTVQFDTFTYKHNTMSPLQKLKDTLANHEAQRNKLLIDLDRAETEQEKKAVLLLLAANKVHLDQVNLEIEVAQNGNK